MAALASRPRVRGLDEPRLTALARQLVTAVHVGALDAEMVIAQLQQLTLRLRGTAALAIRGGGALRQNSLVRHGTTRGRLMNDR